MRKRVFAGFVIAAVLVSTVFIVRETEWSVPLRVPSYRQRGSPSARVVLTEFSDFQCPNCATAEPVLRDLLKRHEGQVLLVFRHFPLNQHKWAFLAARASEAAGLQGHFWEFHDRLFLYQKEWAESNDPKALFLQYAQNLGLNAARFKEDLETDRWDGPIRSDRVQAFARSVNSTPTFFVNQRRLVGESQLRSYGEKSLELESRH